MKRICILLFLTLLVGSAAGQRWTDSDSIDVLHTTVSIDFSRYPATPAFTARAEVLLTLLRPCPKVGLMLNQPIDSMWIDGQPFEGRLDSLPTGHLAAHDTLRLEVAYHHNGQSATGWGGLYLEPNLIYNLGVGFDADPHSVGRTWFPTRDNFTDKCTYTLNVATPAGWTAQCGGLLTAQSTTPQGVQHTSWHIGLPTPAYLVSLTLAPWRVIERDFSGLDSTYHATIAYTTHDSAEVYRTFNILDSVLPAYERAFGPYLWRRIGYCATTQGSMEHVMNISLATRVMCNFSDEAQFGNMCHELAHSWFGNTITCALSGDMWINEGGASFAEEVAVEAVHGREAATRYYQRRLDEVIRTAHLDDGQYRALHGMPHSHTYGTTTYRKGALAWHTLRGTMGDSLFYASMRRLFATCRFANMDAYGLLDSLEAYSGTELYTVADGQIFNPGFWGYHIDSVTYAAGQATVHMTRQRIGMTEDVQLASRVPVTLFDHNFANPVEVWVDFATNHATATLALPYRPVYWAVDYNRRMADAITTARFDNPTPGLSDGGPAHFLLGATAEAQPARVLVEHHWGTPGGPLPQGVVRTAGRYWVVTGTLPADGTYVGHFAYCREGARNAAYPHLDRNFYTHQAQLDSMALLYRPSPAYPWGIATRHHTTDLQEGRFVELNLRPGEYVLAFVDTALLATPAPEATSPALTLVPNPAEGTFAVHFDGPQATLTVADLQGRTVLRQTGVHSGQTISHNLPAGIYVVKIENNFVSLQSQLIVL